MNSQESSVTFIGDCTPNTSNTPNTLKDNSFMNTNANLLSYIFSFLTKEILTSIIPYVSKKWYQAYKDVTIYKKIDKYFIKHFPQSSDVFDTSFNEFPSFSCFLEQLWKEILYAREWICYEIAFRRIYSKEKTSYNTDNNVNSTHNYNNTRFANQKKDMNHECTFGNAAVLNDMLSGTFARTDIFFHRNIVSDLPKMRKINDFLRAQSPLSDILFELETEWKVLLWQSELDVPGLKSIYTIIAFLLKIKVLDNAGISGRDPFSGIPLWLHLASQEIPFEKCKFDHNNVREYPNLSMDRHNYRKIDIRKFVNEDLKNIRIHKHDPYGMSGLFIPHSDSNDPTEFVSSHTNLFKTHVGQWSGLCSDCIRGIAWWMPQYDKSKMLTITSNNDMTMTIIQELIVDKQHAYAAQNFFSKFNRNIIKEVSDSSRIVTNVPIRSEKFITPLDVMISKYQNLILMNDQEISISRRHPHIIDSCMHDANGFQEQCKKYYSQRTSDSTNNNSNSSFNLSYSSDNDIDDIDIDEMDNDENEDNNDGNENIDEMDISSENENEENIYTHNHTYDVNNVDQKIKVI